MKTNPAGACYACSAVAVLTFILCGAVSFRATAQSNSWTGPISGNWQDATWSAGVLPTTNQTILFTNSGWKALAIGAATAQNFPQTLSISSLYISSPGTDTVNTLLLNYSGLQTPLQVGNGYNSVFAIGTNCNVVMLSAALKMLNGTMSVGGTFIESENSSMSVPTLRMGDLAPGVFNLTNSYLDAVGEWVGGSFPATFTQQGGTNYCGLALQDSGEYDLYDGTFGSYIRLNGGNFIQFGGDVSATLDFWRGTYQLNGGTLSSGDEEIPARGAPDSGSPPFSAFSQTGGTSTFGNLTLGVGGVSFCSLSGGTLATSNLDIEIFAEVVGVDPSAFFQSGGYYTNSGISIEGGADRSFFVSKSWYQLDGGILSTPSIALNGGAFSESGGTNIAGTVSLSSVSYYDLAGGWLYANSIQHSGIEYYGQIGYFNQSGGTNVVGSLSLGGGSYYDLAGGRLSAGQIQLAGATFYCALGSSAPGTLDGLNLLTFADGTWDQQTGGQQSLGQLLLAGGTNSFLILPPAPCALNFADSSGLIWSNAAMLTISNWSGSLRGGGNQQITFGHSATALTSQQATGIQFQNPAGLPAGNYPARILATGEVVPIGVPMQSTLAVCGPSANGPCQLSLNGNIGQTYDIEVSTDLVNWVVWTNLLDSNGIISLSDWSTTNYPQRFYRARQAQ